MFSAGYDIGDMPSDVFAVEARSSSRTRSPPRSPRSRRFATRASRCSTATRSAAAWRSRSACDLRIAARDIRLGMPPAKLGLVYSHTGLQKFIDVVGVARTRELFYVGRNVDAPIALRRGASSTRSSTPSELDERALELRPEIAATRRCRCAATSA